MKQVKELKPVERISNADLVQQLPSIVLVAELTGDKKFVDYRQSMEAEIMYRMQQGGK